MSRPVCALAADTKVETPEGAMAIRAVAGKAIAVFTRELSGRVRFRMMLNVRKVGDEQPVLRVTLENRHAFRVGPEQVLFKKGMVECRADALQIGDELEPAFHFPAGYQFRDDAGTSTTSSASLHITAVEPGGVAEIYSLSVNQTGCFYLTAGALCKAEEGEPAASDSSAS